MSQKYYSLLTQIGADKLAAATANQTTIKLTQIAVGDGNGTDTTPNASDEFLVNEVYRSEINELKTDAENSNYIVASSIIPATEGNFWVREIGLFDEDGDLIAIGNKSATFKPVLTDGEANELILRIAIEVSSSDAVELLIDPSVVMASQEYVNEELKNKSDKDHNHDTTYAKLGGVVTQEFLVKAGNDSKSAVNKEQMENTISSINIGKLGVEQIYYDVSSDRFSGDTYTNLTDKPILILVTTIWYSNNGVLDTIEVDGKVVSRQGTHNSVSTTSVGTMIAIVPIGKEYRVTSIRGILNWMEMR